VRWWRLDVVIYYLRRLGVCNWGFVTNSILLSWCKTNTIPCYQSKLPGVRYQSCLVLINIYHAWLEYQDPTGVSFCFHVVSLDLRERNGWPC
jgi:hypothetical protein